MKTSAAILTFFLSAAAWIGHEALTVPQTPAKNAAAQPGNPNAGIVLRPLTD